MKVKHIKFTPAFVCITLLAIGMASCRPKNHDKYIDRSFYYWKTAFKPTDFEKQVLDTLKIKTIYLKFFDVDWSDEKIQPVPKAVLIAGDTNLVRLKKIKIVPAVFITNECIQKISADKIQELADKITSLVKNIFYNSFTGQSVEEVQIDCDWNATTKEKYFTLLSLIKRSDIPVLSATIRLHQVKYVAETGVPPVDKGLLMCYNMGNLKNNAVKNSILDVGELKKYTGKLAGYPLPLDIGLPLFDWYVLFRDNQFRGLVKTLNIEGSAIHEIKDNQYIFFLDTTVGDIRFQKNDLLRREKSDYSEIIKATEVVRDKLKNDTLRVALFHLDSITLKKYSINELESIYNNFR